MNQHRNPVPFLLGTGLLLASACGGEETPCDPDAPGTICTIVGDGTNGYGGDDGPATEARISVPMDMAVGPDGRLWVLDFNNYVIRAVDADGIIEPVVGTGLLGDSPPPDVASVPCTEALFNHTPDLFFTDDYLYLAAWHNTRVKRVDLATMHLENFAGIGRRTLYHGDGGPALAAAVDLPSSVAEAPNGDIVFMDQANQVIRRVDGEGIVHRVAGTCIVDDVVTGSPGQELLACPGSNKLVYGSPETECSRPCNPGFGGDGGLALEARIALPYGQKADPSGRIAFDPDGNLIFADSENNRLRKIDTDGVITTIAGTGEKGFAVDEGAALDAQLSNPVDVEVDADGTIFFADANNNCIRKVDGGGNISTVAGQCSADPADRGFAGDGGDPLDALLDRPYGIELAGDKIYVADSFNNRIRVINR